MKASYFSKGANMKFLLAATLTLASISSMAMKHEGNGEWKKKWDSMAFEEAKKYKTDMLAQNKFMIEDTQACVDKTTDKKGIESCYEKMHEKMEQTHRGMKKKKIENG